MTASQDCTIRRNYTWRGKKRSREVSISYTNPSGDRGLRRGPLQDVWLDLPDTLAHTLEKNTGESQFNCWKKDIYAVPCFMPALDFVVPGWKCIPPKPEYPYEGKLNPKKRKKILRINRIAS